MAQVRDDGFARLVERDLDRVHRFLHGLLRDEDLARDLTHDTFLRLRRSAPAGDDGLPTAAYVFACARHAAVDHWRRLRTRRDAAPHLAADPAPPTPTDAPLHTTELREALDRALGLLDEEHRAVFLLSEVEGLRYAEIAEALGIPPGTVASRKHHAVQDLRRELERMGHAL
ncbi:MAG: RNA polymerase sigma factor [Candidatus Latescibacteria bacterium]|nr:RNA polymerase sigma factor [Candidatus Latescibacterota bacterium]